MNDINLTDTKTKELIELLNDLDEFLSYLKKEQEEARKLLDSNEK